MGNLGIFSLWAIAKPNYYVPCMPGMALLIGAAWVRLGAQARGDGRRARAARVILWSQWALILVVAVVKATLVTMYFMHVKFDWSKLYFLIIPVVILAIMMMVVLLPDTVVAWHHE